MAMENVKDSPLSYPTFKDNNECVDDNSEESQLIQWGVDKDFGNNIVCMRSTRSVRKKTCTNYGRELCLLYEITIVMESM